MIGRVIMKYRQYYVGLIVGLILGVFLGIVI
jgi:hypothetical protein